MMKSGVCEPRVHSICGDDIVASQDVLNVLKDDMDKQMGEGHIAAVVAVVDVAVVGVRRADRCLLAS
ncbi:unnamed protein product [Protopolystoma xenopodis]|uniref:Uncharacterized protein n=1 Tax=Protopolystoma xenopodis TaxID=117903 RepID=A0A448XN08_9PLAT|nr:unnamed protein product [Protopolystoma xenopodis]